jgi:iron complex transport system substrate-binding protein
MLGALATALALAVATRSGGREVVDMQGRKVAIPDRPHKVFATSPPGTYLLYAIDPEVIAGLNFPLWENEKRYTVPSYTRLPVIGGMVGQGRTLNQEVLLQTKPDLILMWTFTDSALQGQYEEIFRKMSIPWVGVKMDSIDEWPAALEFAGDVLGKPERGKALRAYAEQVLKRVHAAVADLPESQRVKIYYAEGVDGLSTERSRSFHVELIPMAGGLNVHGGEPRDHMGMERISPEQIAAYDPDLILVKEPPFLDTLARNPAWSKLRAVKTGNVRLIPYVPFNWFDRPPSFMRLLGVQWLLATLHPERYTMDLVAETRRFYRLFLGVELSEAEARKVLNR